MPQANGVPDQPTPIRLASAADDASTLRESRLIRSAPDGYRIGPARKAMLLAAGVSAILLGALTIAGAMGIKAWPQRALFSILWFAIAALALVSLRPKVSLSPDGVRVINRFRTLVVPWSQFQRFVARRAYLNQYMGHIDTLDGRSIPVQVLVTRGELGGRDSRLEQMVRRLNELAESEEFRV